jgi:hypothetical protein
MSGGVDVVEKGREYTQANESRRSARCKCRSSQGYVEARGRGRRTREQKKRSGMGREKGKTEL